MMYGVFASSVSKLVLQARDKVKVVLTMELITMCLRRIRWWATWINS